MRWFFVDIRYLGIILTDCTEWLNNFKSTIVNSWQTLQYSDRLELNRFSMKSYIYIYFAVIVELKIYHAALHIVGS